MEYTTFKRLIVRYVDQFCGLATGYYSVMMKTRDQQATAVLEDELQAIGQRLRRMTAAVDHYQEETGNEDAKQLLTFLSCACPTGASLIQNHRNEIVKLVNRLPDNL